jgi:hypothetical protein
VERGRDSASTDDRQDSVSRLDGRRCIVHRVHVLCAVQPGSGLLRLQRIGMGERLRDILQRYRRHQHCHGGVQYQRRHSPVGLRQLPVLRWEQHRSDIGAAREQPSHVRGDVCLCMSIYPPPPHTHTHTRTHTSSPLRSFCAPCALRWLSALSVPLPPPPTHHPPPLSLSGIS